jgi:hypothetical protein
VVGDTGLRVDRSRIAIDKGRWPGLGGGLSFGIGLLLNFIVR